MYAIFRLKHIILRLKMITTIPLVKNNALCFTLRIVIITPPLPHISTKAITYKFKVQELQSIIIISNIMIIVIERLNSTHSSLEPCKSLY